MMSSAMTRNDERGKQSVMVSSGCYDSTQTPVPAPEDTHTYRPYPPPLTKYEDVKRDAELFMDTLEKLHATMGTKFKVPTIGGRELDLHRLFVEVTSRGGLEKVIQDRRWRDVTAAFCFPSTATNASFVLRKYYVSLIQHYEQIYFFGAKGWTLPSPAPLHTTATMTIPSQGSVSPVLPFSEARAASQKRRRGMGKCLPPRGSLQSSMGCPVVGVIDGKFEYGYLVTVSVGTTKLQGVLYHTPDCLAPQLQQYSAIAHNNGNDAAMSVTRRRRRRKKSEMRKRDPSHPKPNRSGYNFFFAEQHARLKPLHPGKDREISRMIGDLWNKLSETGKAVYQERGIKDKERYRSEMEEYRERLKNGLIIRNAVPLRQLCPVPETTDLKTETGQGGLPETMGNERSSEGSESEEAQLTDKDSDSEMFTPEAGPGIESINLFGEPSDSGGFEMRRDHEGGTERDDFLESITKESTD